jgi:hypothetical protein
MPTLSFNPADVRRCVNHAYAAKDWSKGFGDRGKPRPQLIFVHDEGLYLMSNGKPGDENKGGPTAMFAAYARGYDPNKLDRQVVWDKAVGGDDFAEYLDLSDDMVDTIQSDTFASFKLTVTQNSIEIRVGTKGGK